MILGQIIGRWGNFMNREVFGEYTDSFLAMRLPIEAVRSRDISENVAAHIIDGTNYIQVHPTFLYEMCIRDSIKAEVVNYKDLLEQGSLAAAREKGLVGMEGKDYVVQDLSLIHI